MDPDVIIQNDKWILDTIQKDVNVKLHVESLKNLDYVHNLKKLLPETLALYMKSLSIYRQRIGQTFPKWKFL